MSEQLDFEVCWATPIQPRNVKPETRRLHRAVLALRRAGHQVYRHGRAGHLVDGVPRGDGWVLHHGRPG